MILGWAAMKVNNRNTTVYGVLYNKLRSGGGIKDVITQVERQLKGQLEVTADPSQVP